MPGFNLDNVEKGVMGVLFYKDLAMSGGEFVMGDTRNPYAVVNYKEEEILLVGDETEKGGGYFVRPGYYTGEVDGIRFDIEITATSVILGYSDEEDSDTLVVSIP